MISDETYESLRKAGNRLPPKGLLKNDKQIAGCREAGKVNTLVLDAVAKCIAPGITTAEIDDVVRRETRALGGIPTCLGYEGFPKAVCTSVNNVICHGIPSEECVLREGDILNVDCTTTYGGYVGDASRMFAIGQIDARAEELIHVTGEAVDLAISHLVPCRSHLGDIGYYIAGHVRRHKFSVVREIGGHGVGLEMHEDPYVAHTGLLGQGMLLLPGMIFTIEPMVNEGSCRFFVDRRDGWTVYTADGKRSAQIEHEILLTDDGWEILSR